MLHMHHALGNRSEARENNEEEIEMDGLLIHCLTEDGGISRLHSMWEERKKCMEMKQIIEHE